MTRDDARPARPTAASKYSLAVARYSEAIDLAGPTPVYLSNRAAAHIKQEAFGLAIADASSSIKLEPSYIKAYYRRGSANAGLAKWKEARKDFKKVLELKPKDKDATKKWKVCDAQVKAIAFKAAMGLGMDDRSSGGGGGGGAGGAGGAGGGKKVDLSSIKVDGAYDGPRLPDEVPESAAAGGAEAAAAAALAPGAGIGVTLPFMQALMEHFRDQKLLHRKYVIQMLQAAIEVFRQTPSLVDIALPMVDDDDAEEEEEEEEEDVEGAEEGADGAAAGGEAAGGEGEAKPKKAKKQKVGHFTVCGDTHGQFYDLLNIFKLGGLPSETNPYLFNGDYVDRGSFSFEVVMTLMGFKLLYPKGLFLTRGNHESKNMNKIYGFEGEVIHKYDVVVMELFTDLFNWLPLGGVIGEKVLVVHGGLFQQPGVKLDDIRRVPRNREPPEQGIMSDIMWSDPQPFPGRGPSKRGVGLSFGPDVTAEFLDDNGLELLVRSHEVKEEGYLVEHDGRCITIFSAPNYCDQMGNKGAFIRFEADMKPRFTQYHAVVSARAQARPCSRR